MKYDPKGARWKLKADLANGVHEELSLQQIAYACGRLKEMNLALQERREASKRGIWDVFRRNGQQVGESTENLMDRVLTPKPKTFYHESLIEYPVGADRKYIKMPTTNNYVLGVHALQNACREMEKKEGFCPHPQFVLDNGSRIYRPLMHSENLVARLQDISLLNHFQDSCTGIVYEKKSTKFKIVPICKELITISKRFKQAYPKVNYADFDYEEFDSSKVRCNVLQSRKEAKQDPLLLASVNGNKDLLSDCVDDTFDQLKKKDKEKGMGFWVRKNTVEDELRALFVNCIYDNSLASGNLGNSACFLRVAQAAEPHG